MESKIFAALRVDPAYIVIVAFVLILLLFVLIINTNMKYRRLKSSYNAFMKGQDGKMLEESFLNKFEKLEEIAEAANKNQEDIKTLFEKMNQNYQKVGIVKYDAFNEMGGKLSFVLTLLDGNDNGWILNVMHSRDGCYNYIKEIVNGESYIELSEEESECLDHAIYEETFGIDMNIKDVK